MASENDVPESGGPVVSVIVPVYNPGPALERSIGSVLAQTMPPEDVEVIFVDDGSTDGSGARLDALAAEHPRVRVVHQAASGSPGAPRNVGLGLARGEYVQFLDADDRLGERALERQVEMARRNGSDIVVGKLVSNFRAVHWGIFRRNREACTIRDAPLIWNLTVCKLFRTAFLRAHDLRFPEGWPKIEDEHFVVRAYLRATTVSVLADEACYFYTERDDGGNQTSQPLDADEYYGHLGLVLDEVEAATTADELRARLVRRFYQVEVLGRLTGEKLLAVGPAERAALVTAARRLALARIDDPVHDGLAPLHRLRSTLLREGRQEALEELARRETSVSLHATAGPVAYAPEGLQIPYRAAARWPDGEPLVLVHDGRRLLLDPRLTDGLAASPLDVRADVEGLETQAALEERGGWIEWVLRAGGRVHLDGVRAMRAGDPAGRLVTPVGRGVVVVDPERPGPSARPLTGGSWDLDLRLRGLGLELRATASAAGAGSDPRAAGRAAARATVGITVDPPATVRTGVGPGGTRALEVRAGSDAVAGLLGGLRARIVTDGPLPAVHVPARMGPTARAGVRLVAGGIDADPPVTLPLAVRERWGGTVIAVAAAGRGAIPAGTHRLRLEIAGAPVMALGTLRVDAAGTMRIGDLDRLGRLERAQLALGDVATSLERGRLAVGRVAMGLRRRSRRGAGYARRVLRVHR